MKSEPAPAIAAEEQVVVTDDHQALMSEIWDEIDEANLAIDREKRRDLIAVPIHRLTQLVHAGRRDALYALGYAYYSHPDRRPGTPELELTEKFLRAAIAEGIEPDLSRLYLAYHNHDCGQYAVSDSLIREINKDALDGNLSTRCTELALCNCLLTTRPSGIAALLTEFADFVSGLDAPDVPPLLLMNTLERLAYDGKLYASCVSALHRLDEAYVVMGDSWFSELISREGYPESPDLENRRKQQK